MPTKKTDRLFVAISGILRSRVTPENLRTSMADISSVRGITGKDKTQIIIEILATLAEMEE